MQGIIHFVTAPTEPRWPRNSSRVTISNKNLTPTSSVVSTSVFAPMGLLSLQSWRPWILLRRIRPLSYCQIQLDPNMDQNLKGWDCSFQRRFFEVYTVIMSYHCKICKIYRFYNLYMYKINWKKKWFVKFTLLLYGFSIAKWKMQNYGFYLKKM